MAFVQANFVMASTGSYDSGASQIWAYKSTGDALATIRASAYFNNASPLPQIGDAIIVWGSDGSDILRVTAVSPNVTVTDWVTLTASEIPLADGTFLIGNGSGIAASQSISQDILISNTGVATIQPAVVTQSKLDSSIIRTTTSYWIDGKTTLAAWATNAHPKAKLVRGFVRLVEAPDASATTYTVLIQNATGTVSMTDTLTFTEGTDAAGVYKAFTPVTAGSADIIEKVDVLNIITAGTTTTLGQVEVTLEWLGQA